MTTSGLGHINLHAPRELLDALKDFYSEVVGLRVGFRPTFPRFGYWLYAGTQPIVHLYEAADDEERRADVAGTFDHVAFDCSGRAEVEAMLRERGVTYRISAVAPARPVQIFLRDPAGNGVELSFAPTDS